MAAKRPWWKARWVGKVPGARKTGWPHTDPRLRAMPGYEHFRCRGLHGDMTKDDCVKRDGKYFCPYCGNRQVGLPDTRKQADEEATGNRRNRLLSDARVKAAHMRADKGEPRKGWTLRKAGVKRDKRGRFAPR